MRYLRLPPGVAVGFREIYVDREHGSSFPAVTAIVQDMVERIGVRRITLVVPLPSEGVSGLLIHFDGLGGPLEVTTSNVFTREGVQGVFFGPGGVLCSHPPHIENVKELHIVGCSFDGGQGFHHIYTVMSNLVSIYFFYCEGHNVGSTCPDQLFVTSIPTPRTHRDSRIGIGIERDYKEKERLASRLKPS